MVVVIGVFFLLIIFFFLLVSVVFVYVIVGVLVFVGILMVLSLIEVKWDDLIEVIFVFIIIVMMLFIYLIMEGIVFGFISYCVMKVCIGRFKEINFFVVVVLILFLIKFVWVG